MKIAIIGAMREEVENLILKLDQLQEHHIHPYTFYTGVLHHHDLVIVKAGVGKVASGMLIATLVQHFTIDQVINMGVAGGLGAIKVGDIVVGTSCIYGDVDITAGSDYVYGQMSHCPLAFPGSERVLQVTTSMEAHHATIMSNDSFTTDLKATNRLIKKHFSAFDVRAVDMESCAFAQACYVLGLPFIAIRAISDVVGSSNQTVSFFDNLDEACKCSNDFILDLLKKL